MSEAAAPTPIQLGERRPKKFTEIVKLFQFNWERDSIGEARSTLLIVVALIATVTFQAGINPPTLLFEKSINIPDKVALSTPDLQVAFPPGQVTSSNTDPDNKGSRLAFLVCNTIAFSAALAIIEYLTGNLPFHRELVIAFFFLAGAYGISIVNENTLGHEIGSVQYYLITVSFLLPQLVRWLPIIVKKLGCCC